mgnify:CR=1 FL=1
MNPQHNQLTAPRRMALWQETRVIGDFVKMLGPLAAAQIRSRASHREKLIVLVPGFGSDDRYMSPLRHYLGRRGYQAEGWGLGKNLAGIDLSHTLEDLSSAWHFSPKPDYRGEASVPYLCDRLTDRVRIRHQAVGYPVTLIGWSLGGYLCREVARDLPDIVEKVITLGSPTIGGPKYTAAAPFFRKRGMDLDWIEREIKRREEQPISQPVTAIYSKSDAIVNWRAALDHHSPNVDHIEVNAAHLGMGFNPEIWSLVLQSLEAEA